jgi:MoaA/NifB/PqqE/SkfB family radical SAM enzyme
VNPTDHATIRFLQVEPTTRCNFTCGFCSGRHMDQTDLDTDVFTLALDRMPQLRHVELQGEGEPLMHPAFFQMARRARQRGIEVSTITNGSMFSPARIDALLDADLGSVLVSLESPDPTEFAALRGGRLDKVLEGVRALVATRNARGLLRPAIGLAVTILRSTEARFPQILEVYRRLGLDGGVVVQTLNPMEDYARTYSEALASETYAGLARAVVERRLLRQVSQAKLDRHGESSSFWTQLFEDRSACPWLRSALYLDRQGRLSTCPYVKDADRHLLGRLRTDDLQTVLSARQRLRLALEAGDIPTPCRGCAIADATARRLPKEALE